MVNLYLFLKLFLSAFLLLCDIVHNVEAIFNIKYGLNIVH